MSNRDPGGGGPTLNCYDCHSVHGANILTGFDAWGWGFPGDISRSLLRNDPAGNGNDANTGVFSVEAPPGGWDGGSAKADASEAVSSTTEIQVAFCGDCHNLNINWTADNDIRPNKRSHPLNADTMLDVIGTTVKVAGASPSNCSACHGDRAVDGSGNKVAWPHQSESHKLLWQSFTTYTDTGTVKSGPGDSYRPLPNLDKTCLWCHVFAGSSQGVGKTY